MFRARGRLVIVREGSGRANLAHGVVVGADVTEDPLVGVGVGIGRHDGQGRSLVEAGVDGGVHDVIVGALGIGHRHHDRVLRRILRVACLEREVDGRG